jgi:hypothetical protein
MKQAPDHVDCTWADLYRDVIEPCLPSALIVKQCHDWLQRYAEDDRAVFPIRAIYASDRRRFKHPLASCSITEAGTRIAFADNAPAWVLLQLLIDNEITSYDALCAEMMCVPCHMFDLPAPLTRITVISSIGILLIFTRRRTVIRLGVCGRPWRSNNGSSSLCTHATCFLSPDAKIVFGGKIKMSLASSPDVMLNAMAMYGTISSS